MQLRRPIAALMTALALFGGGATMTACEAAGQDQNDGTTDSGDQPDENTNEESDQSQDNVPDLTDPEDGVEQGEGNEEDDG
ncbi:hypothetical protein [Geodermatophilus sabuli]|uniref:Uncharacterized protein n=1 Tax=Geodermatophilus sabuli TaxID=1564158 RepID=A0A285EEF6_9ACTN|nr:hypothetical protein [Geodermatophilus sabuli]MBB3084299.1 hypothetical protein [Geodermatophilus sabuli]SNX96431.1 hypothetical protein SAMN06893097_104145 [Geodermatophilus sabuli]